MFDFARNHDDPGLLSRRLLSLSIQETKPIRKREMYVHAAIGWAAIVLVILLALVALP